MVGVRYRQTYVPIEYSPSKNLIIGYRLRIRSENESFSFHAVKSMRTYATIDPKGKQNQPPMIITGLAFSKCLFLINLLKPGTFFTSFDFDSNVNSDKSGPPKKAYAVRQVVHEYEIWIMV